MLPAASFRKNVVRGSTIGEDVRSHPPEGRVVAILSYHKIGSPPAGWQSWFYTPEQTFVAQLRSLATEGWQVIDLATFVRGIDEPARLPARSALLTFDDAYRSFLHTALPELNRLGLPAVMFVPTEFIGGRNTFDAGIESDEPVCSWDDLRELERRGISVQSHAVSHRHFSDLAPAEQEDELHRSKTVLEDGLGKPVVIHAYPYGDPGRDPQLTSKLLRRVGYHAACLYHGGPATLPQPDPYQLTRLAMRPDTDLAAALRCSK